MAVVGVSTITVRPDRMQDYIDQVARPAKRLLESYEEIHSCRLLTAVVAGQATGTVVFITEGDDFAAAGAVLDRLFADPASAELTAVTSESPMAAWQLALWVDVPL